MILDKNFLNNINAIAKERQLPRDFVIETIVNSIQKAYEKKFPENCLEIKIDLDGGVLEANEIYDVVESDNDDFNDYNQIILEDAQKIIKNAKVGDKIKKAIDFSLLNREIATHILQIFKHGITSESNKQIFKEWHNKIGNVYNLEVEKNDSKQGVLVALEGITCYVPRNEQIPGENLLPGQKYLFSIKEVIENSKGWPITLSRSSPEIVKYLLNLNVPEIQENIIEIKAIARVAGFKTKIAVSSNKGSISPIGTIIGPKGERINAISKQINGEKIEVFEYSDDFNKYIANICSPAEIFGVAINDKKTENKEVILVCKPEKLALLIGKKGANVKIISQLLKSNVDVMTIDVANENNLLYNRIVQTNNFTSNNFNSDNKDTSRSFNEKRNFSKKFEKHDDNFNKNRQYKSSPTINNKQNYSNHFDVLSIFDDENINKKDNVYDDLMKANQENKKMNKNNTKKIDIVSSINDIEDE